MENYKGNYRRTIAIVMVIILLLVALTILSYYRDVEIVTNISLAFLIACTTGVIIELINGSKETDTRKTIEYKKELEEMRRKINKFKRDLKYLKKNKYRRNFYQQADLLMCEINSLNEQIGYIYENKSRKSLIRKFLYNQEYNLEQKEAACDEIREDIVNEVNRKNIISKINRYNNRLDKLLYNINREFGIM